MAAMSVLDPRSARHLGAALLLAAAVLGAPQACVLDVEGTGSTFEPRDPVGAGGAGGTGGQPGAGGAGGAASVCGDGALGGQEACDDGNDVDTDGCTGCVVDPGYSCAGEPSTCAPIPPVIVSLGPGLNISIPDDARYDGSIASMTCVTLAVPAAGDAAVRAVELEMGITHSWVGDLVIKVVSPLGTITTVMSRPGVVDEGDTAFETNGKDANLAAAHPIRFADGEPDPAEDMGSGLGGGDVVCQDDMRCDYGPVADSGPGNGFAEFEGEPPAGDWRVCVADGDNNDPGSIDSVKLSVLAW